MRVAARISSSDTATPAPPDRRIHPPLPATARDEQSTPPRRSWARAGHRLAGMPFNVSTIVASAPVVRPAAGAIVDLPSAQQLPESNIATKDQTPGSSNQDHIVRNAEAEILPDLVADRLDPCRTSDASCGWHKESRPIAGSPHPLPGRASRLSSISAPYPRACRIFAGEVASRTVILAISPLPRKAATDAPPLTECFPAPGSLPDRAGATSSPKHRGP